MRFLHANGYTVIRLDEVSGQMRERKPNQKSVAITFDDGYRDFYTDAFPILAKYNFPAAVFVVGTFADGQHVGENGERYMSWKEIKEVAAHGVDIGSHSMTHPKLYCLGHSEIVHEIEQSKNIIQDKLGIAVHSFAYPYAFPEHDSRFVANLRALLQRNDYRTGVCTIIGRARRGHDSLFLPRLPMNSYDDPRFLDAKLNGGYDWLQKIQYSFKVLKSRFS